ncbi:MAG: ADOP family duplicated permease [Gemmatimonadota bacterium]
MRLIEELLYRLRALFTRADLESELDEELRFHVERETEKLVREEGLEPAEARRRALVAFGGVEQAKEGARRARGVPWFENAARDLRFAVRGLRSSPAFAAVVVLTLAIGIGANTAVFSVVDGVLLRPLGFADSDRIVRLLEYMSDGSGRGTISSPNFYDWRDEATVFEAAALYDEYRPTLTGVDEPVRVPAASVSASYFEVLGVRPAAGRFFLPEEDEPGSSRVVLGWGLWQERYGGDPSVVGATIELSGFEYTVVGVAPRGLEDAGLSGDRFEPPRLWRSTPSYFATNGRGGRSFTAVARLRPGVTVERAQEELSAIHARLAERFPENNANRVVRVEPLKDQIVGDVRPALLALLGAVGLVLLIACANVANLLLFRAASRRREVSLRAALGASGGRIAQGLLAESLVLAVLGGLAGVGLAYLATSVLADLAASHLPRVENVGVDPRVLGFTALVTVATALLVGLAPAWRAMRVDAADALAAGGRTSTGDRAQARFRSAVVAAEVALAVVVVIGGALLGRSLAELRAVDPGIAVDRLLVMEVDPPNDPYFGDDADTLLTGLTRLYDGLVDRVLRVPGVRAAGLTDVLPLSGGFNGFAYRVVGPALPDPAAEPPRAELRAVSPAYFEAMGIPRLRGRGFEASDAASAPPVVVVNDALARRHWPEGRAVGERLDIGGEEAATIVGVVGDVTQFSLDRSPEPTVYRPHPQAPGWMRDDQTLVVRTERDPATVAGAVRAAVREVEPRMTIADVRPMSAVLGGTLAQPRFRTLLLGAFSLMALLLAVIGVYGMVAYGVAQRTRELGLRMALGATTRQVAGMVVGEGLRPVLAGTLIGLAAAFGATRLISGLLYGVGATDPLTFALVPITLVAVAALAAWLPVHRAGRRAVSEVLD